MAPFTMWFRTPSHGATLYGMTVPGGKALRLAKPVECLPGVTYKMWEQDGQAAIEVCPAWDRVDPCDVQ